MHIVYNKIIKRIFDFVFSLVLLILLSPFFLIIIILSKIKLGSPILFSQERPGKNERIFRLHKFRSMTNTRDKNGNLLSDEIRLTSYGKFLRRTSIDELPELINILKGEMSFIGPRPLLIKYLPLYNAEQKKRHNVLPGITGLAQVNGRNAISWEKKFNYDIEYVEKISFHLDLKIFFKTIVMVLKREGISYDGEATMPEFLGEEKKPTL